MHNEDAIVFYSFLLPPTQNIFFMPDFSEIATPNRGHEMINDKLRNVVFLLSHDTLQWRLAHLFSGGRGGSEDSSDKPSSHQTRNCKVNKIKASKNPAKQQKLSSKANNGNQAKQTKLSSKKKANNINQPKQTKVLKQSEQQRPSKTDKPIKESEQQQPIKANKAIKQSNKSKQSTQKTTN